MTDLLAEAIKIRSTVNGNGIMLIGKNKAVFSTPKENYVACIAFGWTDGILLITIQQFRLKNSDTFKD